MINIITSNLLIITTSLLTCGWILMSTCAISSLNTLNRTILLSDKIQGTTEGEFVLNNNPNILRNPLNGHENITWVNLPPLHNHVPLAFNTTPWPLKPSLQGADKIVVKNITPRTFPDENIKTHIKFRYGINKSNRENNLKSSQKQPTPLFSNIKLVNSSNLSPSSTSLSPGATVTGFSPTGSNLTASSFFERVESNESLMYSKSEKLLLHRNKRYLVFPEGSSFQLVFDLIIPIVDYTNFAIMGITCAVAWELPSKPPSEIIEIFRTKLNDGSFGPNRRNDSALQSLVYIDRQRTEQQAAEDKKKWREGVAEIQNHYLPQLSATTATTSGHENFLTYVPKTPSPPASSSFNYNDYIQRANNPQPSPFSSGQQTQQQNNYDYEAFDNNQRKTLYANTNGKSSMYRNEFYPYVNKRVYYKDLGSPASKSSFQNWQQKVHQQPQQTNTFYSGRGNWWKRNKDHTERQSQENQSKWWKYQENPQLNAKKLAFNKRTGRNRKILNKPQKHHIYAIFGKRRRRRSSADPLTYNDDEGMTKELHRIHSREHLRTRLKLYGKIEKLYKTRGQNGTACVLRALCETERMHINSYNETPQSFVIELLRSIFALPKDTLTNSKEPLMQVDDHYVKAVSQAHDVTQTCSQQYDECRYSITYNL